jgi:pyrimidine operon attenuation protein / uracil phosphoribosyltransferase
MISINTLNVFDMQGHDKNKNRGQCLISYCSLKNSNRSIIKAFFNERKMKKKIIFTQQDIEDSVIRIAGEIIKRHDSMEDVVLVGIRTCGAFLAKRIQEAIGRMNTPKPPTGVLDITLYRDDWTRISAAPKVEKTDLPFSIDDKIVILIDDVLFTGRTVRAAMDALIDFGRPRKIELAILVDRGDRDRELPIMANYVGGVWNILANETINVHLQEIGQEDHVSIEEKKNI